MSDGQTTLQPASFWMRKCLEGASPKVAPSHEAMSSPLLGSPSALVSFHCPWVYGSSPFRNTPSYRSLAPAEALEKQPEPPSDQPPGGSVGMVHEAAFLARGRCLATQPACLCPFFEEPTNLAGAVAKVQGVVTA